MRLRDIPPRLVIAIQQRRCVPFIGSGFSKQADANHFPNWNQLLERMIRIAEAKCHISKSEARSLDALLKKNRHLMAAESLKSKLPRDLYYSILEEQFDPPNVRPSRVHNLLLELNPQLIITTNYDRLIEDSYAHAARKAMTVVPYSDAAALQRRLQEANIRNRPFLFKIHGSIEDTASIILTENDYRRLMYDERGYTTVLSSIFIHFVVLMLGFSFNDEELILFLGQIRHALKGSANPDYIMLPKKEVSDTEIERFRNDFGLEVITYSSSNKHEEVTSFLSQLVKCYREQNNG
ncbi:MAG: SIR2 family protein [Thermoguttaceae bacterium]|jgi:hypothetical protein